MKIPEILTQIRSKRTCYSQDHGFVIPLEWKHVPNMTFALVPREHARMIAAAAGRDLAPHAMYIHNSDGFLGIGNNSVTMFKNKNSDNYIIRHERRDFSNPITLPSSIDLSSRLRPLEAPDTRPSEMTPEDYYM